MRIAVPPLRATVVTEPGWKPFTDAASFGSSVRRASATVSGAFAASDSMRTALSLSVKMTAPPARVRDQPSGTFTREAGARRRVGDEGLVVGDVAGRADLRRVRVGRGRPRRRADDEDERRAAAGDAARAASAARGDSGGTVRDRHGAATVRRAPVSAPPAPGQRQVKPAGRRSRRRRTLACRWPRPASCIVEDDDAIASGLRRVLDSQGYAVRRIARGGPRCRRRPSRRRRSSSSTSGCPTSTALDVCRRLRAARPELAILILTARDQELDVVAGLDAGADDYLVKPFRLAELLARVRAHLRRLTAVAPEEHGAPISAGGVRLDPAATARVARRTRSSTCARRSSTCSRCSSPRPGAS